jgi:hypothetical protein
MRNNLTDEPIVTHDPFNDPERNGTVWATGFTSAGFGTPTTRCVSVRVSSGSDAVRLYISPNKARAIAAQFNAAADEAERDH